jgi:hypothetical protein
LVRSRPRVSQGCFVMRFAFVFGGVFGGELDGALRAERRRAV